MAAGQEISLERGAGGRRHTMPAVLDVLRRGRRFLVGSHARPDGDAVGSVLACGMMLAQLEKQADLVSADPVPLIYRGLPCATTIRQAQRVEGEYDAVILLECDGLARSRLAGLERRFVVNIDHHVSAREFADVNWIDTDACAVAEMVYRLARGAGVTVTAEMAACLYTGVLTDTGSFCYEGTDVHAFEMARELVCCGADPAQLARDVYFSNPLSKMALLGAALNNLRRDGRLAWLWVTHADMQRTGAAEEDCEGIVNYAIAVAGVEAAVLLRELPDRRVRLSLRSKGRLDVARIASSLGGGGHLHAGGCTMEGPLSAATDRILETMRRELMASVNPGARE
ncbi:MAG TPA: DHH family phosphoesterase [Acidobacteriaceae bacterium]|nr:DHH family phosphoesterase [Acidobacteriaceae bacterium]